MIGSNVLLTGVPIFNELHEHYSASFIVSRNEPFDFRTGSTDWIRSKAVFVRPNVEQQLNAPNEDVFVFLFDPDDVRIRRTLFEFSEEYRELESDDAYGRIAEFLTPPVSENDALRIWKKTLNEFKKNDIPSRPMDPRIESVVKKLSSSVPETISWEEWAASTGLSESRLIHLFKEEVGIPMRKYIQWLRIKACVSYLAQGRSLTAASHEAGFADQAHMSRTFREMFGLKPSLFLKNSSSVQVIFCKMEDDNDL
ncbi:AraC family transcriptional regulator [Leptospira gomenensis]|uniref:AraC family transcriptional regulator n=1 Tax=Leptospira gomenensis TaxID=2484974 RepID=A0A5F1YME0_9LEPT|nr:AraC family transcriptional regulator [Leptospira gomenensis]TGK33281.1 AraC family transcriptional regulator [Leptospira gomenensis]TGK45150.1 AraC family transcriptional regulator [Leptospira gomenensis]TGK50911.1 AraC family transcriptional regulator [Leptospira gomenensis]TGK56534.1 AraC family transcriptional regulator [Leptospira gomenensis]